MKLFCGILKESLIAGKKTHGLGKVSQSTWKAGRFPESVRGCQKICRARAG